MYSSVGSIGNVTSTVPPSKVRPTAKPASSKTRSMGRFPGMTSATKRSMPTLAARAASLLQEAGADPPPLVCVGDGERHLGCCRIAQSHVARKRYDLLGSGLVGKRADQVAVVPPVRVEEWIDERRADRRRAVEAAIEAVLGQRGEEI